MFRFKPPPFVAYWLNTVTKRLSPMPACLEPFYYNELSTVKPFQYLDLFWPFVSPLVRTEVLAFAKVQLLDPADYDRPSMTNLVEVWRYQVRRKRCVILYTEINTS